MYSPSLQLQPISHSHYYVSGDVTIHDSAAIAPGVLLQADPNSRIIIGAGVCIGIGSILHAHQGTLEIGQGANIGAEVLLIGKGRIGAKACIGSATTVLNSDVQLGQVIPPGSLIGDTSPPIEEMEVTDTVITGEPAPETELPTSPASDAATEEVVTDMPQNAGVQVFGQVYVNNLLVKMFPHAQHFRQNLSPDDQSLSGS
jgi:carbon dioxide concentrating mechanism protein CcmN